MLIARTAGGHLSRKLDQESRNGCTPEPATSVTVSSHPSPDLQTSHPEGERAQREDPCSF